MAVCCVFYTPGAQDTCQVLRVAGASPRVRKTQKHLEARFCLSGRFIACPLFTRVERGLIEVNQFRKTSKQSQPDLADVQAAS
jgi:hypothetical protein